MKVLIIGVDGYLGWTLANYLANRGHDTARIDNYSRRTKNTSLSQKSGGREDGRK